MLKLTLVKLEKRIAPRYVPFWTEADAEKTTQDQEPENEVSRMLKLTLVKLEKRIAPRYVPFW